MAHQTSCRKKNVKVSLSTWLELQVQIYTALQDNNAVYVFVHECHTEKIT